MKYLRLNGRNNFWKIKSTDPLVIRITKILLFIYFFLVIGLFATLDLWSKRVAESNYLYEITMRGGHIYYVPNYLGLIIHSGMILLSLLFLFNFSYIFWPLSNGEKNKILEKRN